MGVWETREASFEASQKIGEQLRFQSLARRNKLLGLWAAEKLGMTHPAAEDYAHRLVLSLVGKEDDEALAQFFEAEFAKLDPPLSGHRIRRKIDETTAIATREIFEGR
jgi:hypothetical protein